ncbi:MAG: universal stress protein [Acidothermaceae bacterium]
MFEYGKDGPRVVLVCVDGSATSFRAGAYGAGLARRQGAKLVLLYVTPAPSGLVSLTPASALGIEEAHDQIEADLRKQAAERAAELGIDYEILRKRGDPYREIIAAAEKMHADAIVVGASSALGHRFVGSLAVHLVRAGGWPITVVP